MVEVYSALRRRERGGELPPAHASDALAARGREFSLMTEQPLNSSVVEAAKQLIDRHALRALDAIQLATCWIGRLTSGITDIVFVASDQILLKAADAEGFQTFDPED